MITRCHRDADRRSSAIYSSCERYRYALTREWADGPHLLYVMLNPSTADERQNDPTIERCERRARSWGYGAMKIANIFGFRATRPEVLKTAGDPVGPGNDGVLSDALERYDRIICAWGVHGAFLGRGRQVETFLRARKAELYHLGLTKDRHPRHPLYVSYAQGPVLWQ